jgi:hypothetical protein
MKQNKSMAKKIKEGMYLIAGICGLPASFMVGMLSEQGLVKILCILLLILSVHSLESLSNKND